MEKGIIYYKMLESETREEVISKIRKIEVFIETAQVFIDPYDDNRNLFELCDYPLDDIQTIYLNRDMENEFEKSLLMQVSVNSNCEIKHLNYFKNKN